jgi:signal transduction histidine kinase
VENACKYGGPPIHVGASTHLGTLRLSVRDHGPGVPPPVARRIFRPFERGARDETDAVRGLGLGLALSRGLARDLGGDLTLEAPPDGGACFVLTLPVAG